MGHGVNVQIGIDPITGMENSFILSPSLVSYLHDYGIFTLNHIAVKISKFSSIGSGDIWLSVEELELGGDWKKEWDTYIHSLISLGIKLNSKEDAWVWSFNESNGHVSTKLAY